MIINNKKTLVVGVGNIEMTFELTHSTNHKRHTLIRRETERKRLLKKNIFLDEDFIT
jgi:hypothetical protein